MVSRILTALLLAFMLSFHPQLASAKQECSNSFPWNPVDVLLGSGKGKFYSLEKGTEYSPPNKMRETSELRYFRAEDFAEATLYRQDKFIEYFERFNELMDTPAGKANLKSVNSDVVGVLVRSSLNTVRPWATLLPKEVYSKFLLGVLPRLLDSINFKSDTTRKFIADDIPSLVNILGVKDPAVQEVVQKMITYSAYTSRYRGQNSAVVTWQGEVVGIYKTVGDNSFLALRNIKDHKGQVVMTAGGV